MKTLIVGITAAGSVGLIRGQCKYFSKLGYKVYLLAPRSEQTIRFCKEEGCRLLAVELKREINLAYDLISLIKIIYHFTRVRPNVVNLGTPKVSLLGMIAAWLCSVKMRVYTCRGLRYESESGPLRWLLVLFERVIAKISHKIICISYSVKELGIKDGIFDIKKAIVIGNGSSNGLDLTLFNTKKINHHSRNILKEALGITPGNFVFGFVGRICDRKGINELYEAFLMIEKEYSNVKLIMVGSVEYFQIRDKHLIEKYKSNANIVLTGKIDFNKVPLYMSIFDCFVLPTWAEGFGNVLVQAAALGIPVISNRVTGCKDAVKDGFNGVLIKEIKRPLELKEAMVSLMKSPDERDRLGKNGRVWATNFDQEFIWNSLRAIYDE